MKYSNGSMDVKVEMIPTGPRQLNAMYNALTELRNSKRYTKEEQHEIDKIQREMEITEPLYYGACGPNYIKK